MNSNEHRDAENILVTIACSAINADGSIIIFNSAEDETEMKSDSHSIELFHQCELCEKKRNTETRVFSNDTHLCEVCLNHVEKLPEIVAKSVERFLIGNVV